MLKNEQRKIRSYDPFDIAQGRQKIRSYDKNGYGKKGVMNVFVNQMRKFLVRNAQVFKITLKMGVVFFIFFIFFDFLL